MHFVHHTLGQQVRFGAGGVVEHTARAVSELGASRVLIISSTSRAEVADRIEQVVPTAGRFTEVVRHVPVEVAERATLAATSCRADALVCVGGGSATGLAKAVALHTALPIIAVPTTYSGSEATDVWGITENSRKTTGSDRRVLPTSVVYDADLTRDLPLPLTVASGLNALAHSVDALWAPRADPINAMYAEEAIRALRAGLTTLVADPGDRDGREQTLFAAYISAVAFASAGSGLHHKLCHVLGGMFDLPHAETHAVVLPHVLRFNAGAAPAAERRIARALGADTATVGLEQLYRSLGVGGSLRALGMPLAGIDDAAAAAMPLVPTDNPGPVDHRGLADLLRGAWEGQLIP